MEDLKLEKNKSVRLLGPVSLEEMDALDKGVATGESGALTYKEADLGSRARAIAERIGATGAAHEVIVVSGVDNEGAPVADMHYADGSDFGTRVKADNPVTQTQLPGLPASGDDALRQMGIR